MKAAKSAERRIDFRIKNEQISLIGRTANHEFIIEILIGILSLMIGIF